MGFPLLRLPHLVITNILDITDITDLTCLSLCSKRTRNILIVCRRRNRFEKQYIRATVVTDHISVDAPNSQVIEVIQISNLESYIQTGSSKGCQLFLNRTVASVTDEIRELETVEIGGKRVPCFRNSQVLMTFWEHETIGLRKCMDFVRETFEIPVKHLVFSQNGMWAFDWINGWEEKIQKMTVRVTGIQDHQLEYVLKNCESRMLVTSQESPVEDKECYPSKSFCFNFDEMKSKFFIAELGHWITFESLVPSSVQSLEIKDSNWTNFDFHLVLMGWSIGILPDLRRIIIQLCEPISIATITSDVDNALLKTNDRYKFNKQGYENLPYVQYDLKQRGDGNKRACIRFYDYKNSVLMRVWD